MAGLTYYTLAYVGIQDNSLRVAWTVGLIAVVFWTCVAVFFERGYLQQDPVTTGVARLKVLECPSGHESFDVAYMESQHYGRWYAEDLILQKGSAEVFVVTRVKEETIHHDQRANECALDERAVLANETEDHTFRSSGHDADDYLSVKENKNQTKEDAFKAPNHDMREDFASEQENHKAEGHVVDRATGYVLNNEISGKKEIEGKWVSTQKAAKRVHHGSSSGKQEDQGICSAQSSPRDVHVADTRDHGQRLLRSLLVASHDHPQVSSDSHGRRVYMSTKDMSGVLKRVTNGTPSLSACGTVWDEGVGEILHALGTRDEIRLIDVVCAAGIDASDEARVCELMRKGTTLSLLYTYKQDDSHGIWAHFWRNSPLRYELSVAALPAPGKVREVERLGGSKSSRLRRSMVGITVQVHRRGWVGHWSWGKLLAELVLKFGLLGIVTHLLDAYWQFVLPLTGGRNYNKDVYRQVGGEKMKPA